MVAHWAGYADPAYLDFIEQARPQVVQHGFYGATFYGLVHTPQYKGYPAHFPVQGLQECGQWLVERNARLHARGAKVVGHFNVEFLFGDPDGPEGPRGFFDFYRNHWDEAKLGPKPVDDPTALLERDAEGKPIGQGHYKIGGMGEYWACLRNPHWQQVLKAWVKRSVEMEVDGLIANYFYRHNCLCEHCRREFHDYLSRRFTAGQLEEKFGIAELAKHRFQEIVSWHNPKESTPLRLEMLRFSQLSNKQVFDEVFVRYGQSLKPDLIVAQWNHLGAFSQISGDERCLLPGDVWGRDESYLWYSTGASAHVTDLENGNLGEGTLQARYIRGAFDDKPFTLGKYEQTRIRAAIAELAANGGAPMGFYTRFTDPAARQVIVRYYQFLKRHAEIYHANLPHAEAVLLFPRKSVHQGDVASVARFRQLGNELLDRHLLFDVLPDDLATPERLSAYRHVLRVEEPVRLSPEDPTLSRFEAPTTVRISASRPAAGNEITLHLVNYNRIEPPKDKQGRPSPGRGVQDEKPLPVDGVTADLALPTKSSVTSIQFLTPESGSATDVAFNVDEGRVRFRVPKFLVYGVARVVLESSKP